MILLRRIVFYLFLVLFLAGAPLLVLYALGYIYRPGSEQGIVKTGLASFATMPPGASLYLGERRYSERTPARIRGLLPGTYPVRIVLKDHHPWSATISVEAGRATVFEKILLRPQTWETRLLAQGPFRDLLALKGTRTLLLLPERTGTSPVVYKGDEEKLFPLSLSLGPGARLLDIISINESPYVLLKLEEGGEERWIWTKLEEGYEEPQDLTPLLIEEPERIEWDAGKDRYLYAIRKGDLSRLDAEQESVRPPFLQGVRGFGLHREKLFILKDPDTFLRMDLEGENRKFLLQDPVLFQRLFGTEGFFRILIFSRKVMFFLGPEGKLVTNLLPYELVEKGVRGLAFDEEHKKAAVWTEEAVGILDLAEEEDEVFEKGPMPAWVYEKGKALQSVHWVYEGAYLLFQDGNQVFLLELRAAGESLAYGVTEAQEKSGIHYDEETGVLFYLDRSSGDLKSLQLAPKKEILNYEV